MLRLGAGITGRPQREAQLPCLSFSFGTGLRPLTSLCEVSLR